MTDEATPVPSPCISVCRMNPASGLCEGCLRTLDEIAAWGGMSESGKREVWQRIEQRSLELVELKP
jgi:uncharacterized protein